MICKKCGKALPADGAVCKFCGAMMTQTQLEERKKYSDPTDFTKVNLLSDKYGVDKSNLYINNNAPKENKFLGAIIILVVLLILIIMVIIINMGR